MDLERIITYWCKHLEGIRRQIRFRAFVKWIILSFVITSCEADPYGSHWQGPDNLTICQYLEKNKEEYSKSYQLLVESKMLNPLCGYNPYGEDYTLFLPTDEAINHFVQQNENYESFDEMLLDTGFINTLTRYHTLKRKVHSNEFPDGVLLDSTLTGDRLAIGFFTDGDNAQIKVNHVAPIIKANLDMSNGYIHVISEVLQKPDVSGYEWLQKQNEYSILARAMELSGIKYRLWWKKYTIFAEHDSVYNKIGINRIEDLINRVATPGLAYTNTANSFYKFTAYHLVGGEFFLNELKWGNNKYTTMASKYMIIDVGHEIRINLGVDSFGVTISASGDTTLIDYVRPIWENSNIPTNTGPVHSISDIMSFEPFPKEDY